MNNPGLRDFFFFFFLLESTENTIASCIYHMCLTFVVNAADCNFVGSQGSMDLGS
jgi:hypothetical protein